MRSCARTLLALFLAICSHQLPAGTLTVDILADPARADGTPEHPFSTVRAAVAAAAAGDTIEVLPGTYPERLSLTKDVRLRGVAGPARTILDGSFTSTGGTATVYVTGAAVLLEGLAITGGGNGVELQTIGLISLRNCIVYQNTGHGVFLDRNSSSVPDCTIVNCLVSSNGGSGIFLQDWGDCCYGFSGSTRYWLPQISISNSVLSMNSQWGIQSSITGDSHAGRATVDRNITYGNGLGAFGPAFANRAWWGGVQIVFGTNTEADPLFLGDLSNLDFRIAPDSPCRDAGAGLDPDGSPADIGAFGGPGSQAFFTSPNDGPVIRSVIVEPAYVDPNGTFTIKAVGAVK